jgi:hypothetical protein
MFHFCSPTVIDALTFLISALLLYMMKGDYNVTTSRTDDDDDNDDDDDDKNDVSKKAHHSMDSEAYGSGSLLTYTTSTGGTTTTGLQAYASSAWDSFHSMTLEAAQYLRYSSLVGGVIFFKFTAALSYGATDVLNVALSEQEEEEDETRGHEETDDDTTTNRSSERLGILFACMGLGCVLGPILAEPWHDLSTDPVSVQRSCVVALGIASMGYLGWGIGPSSSTTWKIFSSDDSHTPAATTFLSSSSSSSSSLYTLYFTWMCFFAMIRSAGASILWINSSLLLQKFTDPTMLGRVMAADYALALLAEAFSALVCGILMDDDDSSSWTNGMFATVDHVSLLMGCSSTFWMVVWSFYHCSGRGAKAASALEDTVKMMTTKTTTTSSFASSELDDDDDDEEPRLMLKVRTRAAAVQESDPSLTMSETSRLLP